MILKLQCLDGNMRLLCLYMQQKIFKILFRCSFKSPYTTSALLHNLFTGRPLNDGHPYSSKPEAFLEISGLLWGTIEPNRYVYYRAQTLSVYLALYFGIKKA